MNQICMVSNIEWGPLPKGTIIHTLYPVLSEWLIFQNIDFQDQSVTTGSEIPTLSTHLFSLCLGSLMYKQIIHSE